VGINEAPQTRRIEFSNSARREQKCLHRMAQDKLEEAKKV
jgi:hypothetical protein